MGFASRFINSSVGAEKRPPKKEGRKTEAKNSDLLQKKTGGLKENAGLKREFPLTSTISGKQEGGQRSLKTQKIRIVSHAGAIRRRAAWVQNKYSSLTGGGKQG